jgi:HD-GYP domain-containing protein (c-di-GMP phosphodiesterase class II)
MQTQKANNHHKEILRIIELTNHVADTEDLGDLLNQMLILCVNTSGARAGFIYLPDDTKHRLVVKAAQGFNTASTVMGKSVNIENSIAGRGYETRQITHFIEPANEPAWQHEPDFIKLLAPKNMLLIPMSAQEKSIAVLQLFDTQELDLYLLQIICERMSSEIHKLVVLENNKKYSNRLRVLPEIIGRIGSTLDQDQLLRLMIKDASQLLNAEASSLFLKDEKTGELILKISSAKGNQAGENLRVPAGRGIIGYVVQTGESIIVSDTSNDRRHYDAVDQATDFNTRSIVAVPMRTHSIQLGNDRGTAGEQIIGGIEALNKLDGTFDQNDGLLLEAFAGQAATILYIARLYREANELFLDAIEALTTAIDAKDPYTEGHSRRVSDYSVAIARKLHLDSELIHHIRIGSMLHDVGKIGIPDQVLKKPGSLTIDEYSTMKAHPVIGERIMGQVHMLQSELAAIIEHHERLDGNGYPLGLKGKQISIMGRIVAVADAFDAMTSNRPYRKALSIDEAFHRLRASVNIEFDKDCVEALINSQS